MAIKIVVLMGNICGGKTTFAKILERPEHKVKWKYMPLEESKRYMGYDVVGVKRSEYEKSDKKVYNEYARRVIELGHHVFLGGKLILESVGGDKNWKIFLDKIKKEFKENVITIMIYAEPKVCFERAIKELKYKDRDKKELRKEINMLDRRLKINSDFEVLLDNNRTEREFEKSVLQTIKTIGLLGH